MSRYLLNYVGKYRVKAEYDLETNDYPRDESGHIDQTFEDLYIDCAHGCRITHYDTKGTRVILEGYCPTKTRGKNIVKELGDVALDVGINDQEVWFRFNADDIERVAEVMKAKTSGKAISPFSTKNLPKTPYKIPEEDMQLYRQSITGLERGKLIYLSHWTREFLTCICKADAVKNAKRDGLSIKNYIHKTGCWKEYCDYLRMRIGEQNG